MRQQEITTELSKLSLGRTPKPPNQLFPKKNSSFTFQTLLQPMTNETQTQLKNAKNASKKRLLSSDSVLHIIKICRNQDFGV